MPAARPHGTAFAMEGLFAMEGFGLVVGNLESGGVFMLHERLQRVGNVRWGLIAALLGLPLPIVLLALLFMGGCGN